MTQRHVFVVNDITGHSWWHTVPETMLELVPCPEDHTLHIYDGPDPKLVVPVLIEGGGVTFDDHTPAAPSPEDMLAAIKLDCLKKIDADVQAIRALFLTQGQELTYLTKETLARSWTEEADPADFPMLAAEATVRGISIADQVALVITTADMWRAIDSIIEPRRMQAKLEVAAATTPEAATAAAAVNWLALLPES